MTVARHTKKHFLRIKPPNLFHYTEIGKLWQIILRNDVCTTTINFIQIEYQMRCQVVHLLRFVHQKSSDDHLFD